MGRAKLKRGPEPIEDTIARAVGRVLDPCFSKLGEQISISTIGLMATNLVQRLGFDQHEAVSVAIQMLSAAEESHALLRDTHTAYEREQKAAQSGEWLTCDSKAQDDSFRQYLKLAGAPKHIRKRGFTAHRNALLKFNLLVIRGERP